MILYVSWMEASCRDPPVPQTRTPLHSLQRYCARVCRYVRTVRRYSGTLLHKQVNIKAANDPLNAPYIPDFSDNMNIFHQSLEFCV